MRSFVDESAGRTVTSTIRIAHYGSTRLLYSNNFQNKLAESFNTVSRRVLERSSDSSSELFIHPTEA